MQPNLTWDGTGGSWDSYASDPDALWDLATLAAFESLGLSLSEIVAITGLLSRSDTLVVSLTEFQTSLSFLSRTDSLTVVLTESPTIGVVLTATDNLIVQLGEATNILVNLAALDSLLVGLTEFADDQVTLITLDTLGIAAGELVLLPMPVFLELLDDLTVQVDDLGLMYVNIVSLTGETLAIGLSETQIHCIEDWPQEIPETGNWQKAAVEPGDPWRKAPAIVDGWTESTAIDSQEEGCST